MKNILVLCIGNICRSPMAEGLLKAQMPESNISSAGLSAVVGSGPDPFAIELMRDQGIDISRHIARQVSFTDCKTAELVLVMDRQQKLFLENLYPSCRGKIFSIIEPVAISVPDPYRGTYEDFKNAYSLIARGVSRWVDLLKQVSSNGINGRE